MATAVWVGYPQGNIPMNDGFGGTLAAPIWHDYMQTASGGYCGNWTPPTVPFQGTAFFGPHAATGAPTTAPGSQTQTNGAKPNTTTSGGAGLGTSTGTSTTNGQYTNPTLYAQPPQPGSGTATTPATDRGRHRCHGRHHQEALTDRSRRSCW